MEKHVKSRTRWARHVERPEDCQKDQGRQKRKDEMGKQQMGRQIETEPRKVWPLAWTTINRWPLEERKNSKGTKQQ